MSDVLTRSGCNNGIHTRLRCVRGEKTAKMNGEGACVGCIDVHISSNRPFFLTTLPPGQSFAGAHLFFKGKKTREPAVRRWRSESRRRSYYRKGEQTDPTYYFQSWMSGLLGMFAVQGSYFETLNGPVCWFVQVWQDLFHCLPRLLMYVVK